MVTQIEEDAERVLEALAEWAKSENDANIGRYWVSGEELQAKLGISPSQINDAVDYLVSTGYVKRLTDKLTAPYVFRGVWLTPEGRLAYQKAEAQANETSTGEDATDKQYDVFLSHHSSRDDDALAADVKALLERNGIRTFATPGSIPTGLWQPQIEQALRTSSTIWVLLTPSALRESVWAHHEFGYFYGYGHGKGRDLKGDNCRFLYVPGTELKGLYEHFQGTGIESLEDPVAVARAIAEGLGREFRVPPGWVRQRYPQPAASVRHPTFGQVSLAQSGNSDGAGINRVEIEIHEIGETIHNLAAVAVHPDVEVAMVAAPDVVASSSSNRILGGRVVLHLRYRDQPLGTLPEKLIDDRGRAFDVRPGPRAPEGRTPLLVTFETDDRRALAAIFYWSVSRHNKGFPEFNLRPTVPMDWREGTMPSK